MEPAVNREAWLQALTERVSPWYKAMGTPLPKLRVSIGFPSGGKKGKAIGECWSNECSKDLHYEIFIRPDLEDPMTVAATLVHELIHAAIGIQEKHGPKFKECALILGLEGPMRATVAGEKLVMQLLPILNELGPIPHASLQFKGGMKEKPKEQESRFMQVECPECGCNVRISKKWAEKSGLPMCGQHRLIMREKVNE